ncbi:MAG: endonuclease/exonuclease/phosphatase family protein [Chloroflexota bacterium]|nr:endonuclease/exonuclease/phosphatase family protein [Chloroflexota bacterium]
MTSIRIATLNLWNSDNTDHLQINRLSAAAEALIRLDADVVALQEVAMDFGEHADAAHWLAERTGHAHVLVHRYADEPGEGLAFLARTPLRHRPLADDIDIALRVETTIGDVPLALTNVHLDWRSVLTRERQIAEIATLVAHESGGNRYEILLGDFNSYPESSVYQFLAGQQTLHGHETVPWHDLARTWAERAGSTPAPTLDFPRNPRWRDAPKSERPARRDWILVRDTFAAKLISPSLTGAGIFGDEAAPITRVVPSDHYGVHADLFIPDGEMRQ